MAFKMGNDDLIFKVRLKSAKGLFMELKEILVKNLNLSLHMQDVTFKMIISGLPPGMEEASGRWLAPDEVGFYILLSHERKHTWPRHRVTGCRNSSLFCTSRGEGSARWALPGTASSLPTNKASLLAPANKASCLLSSSFTC